MTPVAEWKTLGKPQAAPAARDKVTGRHQYPSDMKRPGMLYGSVLRSPTYRGKLVSVDLAPAKAMEGVVAVQDGEFVGVAAPTSFAAGKAIEAVAKTANGKTSPHAVERRAVRLSARAMPAACRRIRLPTRWQSGAEVAEADVHDRLRAARAAGAADGGGRVGRTASSRCGPARRIRSACAASCAGVSAGATSECG